MKAPPRFEACGVSITLHYRCKFYRLNVGSKESSPDRLCRSDVGSKESSSDRLCSSDVGSKESSSDRLCRLDVHIRGAEHIFVTWMSDPRSQVRIDLVVWMSDPNLEKEKYIFLHVLHSRNRRISILRGGVSWIRI